MYIFIYYLFILSISIILSIYNSIYYSIILSIYHSIYYSIILSTTLSFYLLLYHSIYLSFFLSLYLSTILSFNLSIYLSIYHYLPIYLSLFTYPSITIYLSTYPSISQSIIRYSIASDPGAGILQRIHFWLTVLRHFRRQQRTWQGPPWRRRRQHIRGLLGQLQPDQRVPGTDVVRPTGHRSGRFNRQKSGNFVNRDQYYQLNLAVIQLL